MDQLNLHPLEKEIDRIVKELGGDLHKMKHVTDSGVSYSFVFNSESGGGVLAYFALPVYVPTRLDNLFRLEFVIASVRIKDVGRFLFAITLDLDMHRHFALRVIPRTKDQYEYQMILQCVCAVDTVREGFVASTVMTGLELAEFYRMEFVERKSED